MGTCATKGKILVVEDEPALQKVIRRRAERAGLSVTSALTCDEGLALAAAEKPDLMVVDVQLPDGSGITLLRSLKADPRTRDIPVVAWSGCDEWKVEALSEGATAYFEKSDVKQMVAMIVDTLK